MLDTKASDRRPDATLEPLQLCESSLAAPVQLCGSSFGLALALTAYAAAGFAAGVVVGRCCT